MEVNEFKKKSVVFNVIDPDQKRLYEHAAKRSNFSSYIKRLIQKDMDGVFSSRAVHALPEEVQEDKLDESLSNNLI